MDGPKRAVDAPPPMPTWVKVSLGVALALVVAFVVAHLLGGGLGGHVP